MRDLMPRLLTWWEADQPFALATVIETWRSAPRVPGTGMAVGADGAIVGSVSAGCVESDLVEVCTDVLRTGRSRLVRYGVTDGDALQAGLMCGGTIEVFVRRVHRSAELDLAELAALIEAGTPVALATVVEHPFPNLVGRSLRLAPRGDGIVGVAGTLGSRRLDDAVRDDAVGRLAASTNATLTYGPAGQRCGAGIRVFVQSFAPRPRLLVFGAVDFAAALARVGRFLGYAVTVCDARPAFTTADRFPEAEQVVRAQPYRFLAAEAEAGRIDERTAICVLTHDPRFDVPVLETALRLPYLGYIGAMGSRSTHEDRMARLRERGLTETELARLRSPIGLDLGGHTPEETALSIAAEIVSTRWGGSGSNLTDSAGPIHGTVAVRDTRTVPTSSNSS